MSKNKLWNTIIELRKENTKLKEELAYVRFELEELRSNRYKSKHKPPSNNPNNIPLSPKKKGGLFGHIGWFRKKPKKIDRVEEVRLSSCPECGSKDITECDKIDEHTQEDIVLPRAETTLYRHHHYYCSSCHKIISGKGNDELTNSYIGPKAKAFAAFLRYGIKISERDVRILFERAFNLKIVASSIAGFRYQLKRAGLPLYHLLMESLKKGSFIHADETGWKINGENRWLWKFSNKKVSVSHIDKSRGQKVVEEIIGDKYNGTLISDFLSAYNKIPARNKQRCLIHIMRDLDKVKAYWHDDKEVMRYCERLQKIFEDAILLRKKYDNKHFDNSYLQKRNALVLSLQDFGFPNPNKRILKRFAKRLSRHKDELLTFLYEKDVDYHNNHAEQQIRPDVIFRKITFGNRSENGAQYHSVIASILQTAKLNGIDPINTFKDILLGSKQHALLSALAPPE
ncbi:MAG: IS66 family transposase [Candidatus Omnitrophota bacterium]